VATKTYEGANATTGFAGQFTNGVISRIEAQAYKLLYDEGVLPRLCKPIGQGQKGSAIVYPYFDPTTIAEGGSVLNEVNDFVNYTQLTNASVIITASEMGITSFVTDVVKEDAIVDIPGEIARQQGYTCAVRLEKMILNRIAAGVTTGTVTGTNSTNGFTFTHYAAAKARLDASKISVPGTKNAVVPAYSWYWTAKSTYTQTYAAAMPGVGEQVVSRYFVQRLWGDIDVYQHSLAYVAASSGAAGFMFVKEGVGLWKPRDFRLEKDRDASARGDEVISTFRAGAKVLISNYVQRLRMYAAAPTGI
jgi:hypothetical protein